MMAQEKGMEKLKDFMMNEKDTDLLQNGARILSCLTQDSQSWVSKCLSDKSICTGFQWIFLVFLLILLDDRFTYKVWISLCEWFAMSRIRESLW